jgi:hypothetical protein
MVDSIQTKTIGGSEMSNFDMNNINQQMIIAGMAGLIDEGLTFHEMMEVVEDIKRQTFPAMMEISRENARA